MGRRVDGKNGPGQARVHQIPESSLGFRSELPSAPGRQFGGHLLGDRQFGDRLLRQLSAGVGSPLGRRGFLVTRPDLRHPVQTRRCCARPSTTARTRCRFGCQTRRLALFAWLRLLPNWIPLPQISQTRDIDSSMGQDESRGYRSRAPLASRISFLFPPDRGPSIPGLPGSATSPVPLLPALGAVTPWIPTPRSST